jgi:hypothetical protein
MKYRDNATIKQVNKHQSKEDDFSFDGKSQREKRRVQKRYLETIRIKIPNKFWWDSLSDNDKLMIAQMYKNTDINVLMKKYPGNIQIQRDAKLNVLCQKK